MTTVHSPLVSPLRAAGYAVLPTPRETRLTGETVRVHADWRLAHRAVDADDIAVRTLQSRLEEEHGFRLTGPANVNSPTVELAIDPQSVETDTDDDRQTQAYTLDIGPNRIVATGVGPAGLFYAVQTLLHLFDSGQGRLPQGRIRDWPRLAWRCIHWDTKHHQDTLETLRRYLDQAARYKINAVLFELEDKFAYPSHPVIGAPGAFTPADGARNAGRLSAARDTFFDPALTDEAPMGAIAAAWDDAGLHNESFWLGWAHMAQHAWTPTAVSVEETTATFMDIHYGRGTAESMAAAYRTLHNAARLYEQTLEKLPSKVRGPAYGHPLWKGPMPRCDTGMMPPAEPRLPNDTAVSMPPVFGKRYAEAVARAPAAQDDCERLIEQLHGLLGRAQRNRYAIEVLISLTTHLRHFFRIVADVAKAEDSLRQAALAGKQGEHRQARRALIRARDTVRDTLRDGQAVFEGLRAVWERSQRPRNAPADGKFFVHVMDDVKDHFADRRADLTYLIAPEETLNLGDWLTQIDETIQRYDAATNRE